jgi:hypothetical protein
MKMWKEEPKHALSRRLQACFIAPFVIALALASSPLNSPASAQDDPSAPVPFLGSVPKAICGPGDHTESGLQGQTTPQERSSGYSERAYNCNLELVGQFQGERNYSQDGPAYFGD